MNYRHPRNKTMGVEGSHANLCGFDCQPSKGVKWHCLPARPLPLLVCDKKGLAYLLFYVLANPCARTQGQCSLQVCPASPMFSGLGPSYALQEVLLNEWINAWINVFAFPQTCLHCRLVISHWVQSMFFNTVTLIIKAQSLTYANKCWFSLIDSITFPSLEY